MHCISSRPVFRVLDGVVLDNMKSYRLASKSSACSVPRPGIAHLVNRCDIVRGLTTR